MKNKLPKVNFEDILTDYSREEDLVEVPLERRIFKIFGWFVLILAGLAVARMIDLGVVDHSFYESRALANMSYSVVEVAPRGVIYDRFNTPLIFNEPILNVSLVPHDLPKDLEERMDIMSRVSEILGIDQEELNKRLREKDWRFSEKLLLLSNPSHSQIATLESSQFSGIRIESSFRRVHRSSRAFSHILGFVGLLDAEDLEENPNLFIDDEIGKAGLEAYYDDYLRGVNSREVYLRDALGEVKEKDQTILGKSGQELYTFIDAEFQEYFYNRLREGLRVLGRNVGVGIALNPQNGEILALFSIPGVDTSNIPSFLDNDNQPFFNRAVSGLYTPGSTIKPLHALAALSEGVITPEKEILSQGFIEIPNPYDSSRVSRFLDWKPHGLVDMTAAIARSSNVYFYEIGGGFEGQAGLGILRLRDWWQKFKLDEKTGIDLPGEAKGFLPSPSWKEERFNDIWRLGDTYNVSIGQGDLLVTPLGLLNYISAIAADGVFYKPRIAAAGEPEVLEDLSEEFMDYIKVVQEGMRDAVREPYGTANFLSSLPVSVSAKTGTAQVLSGEKLNAFFVGYAPSEDPEIAVLVLVEDAREGSLNTVPIAYDVFLWYYNNRIRN